MSEDLKGLRVFDPDATSTRSHLLTSLCPVSIPALSLRPTPLAMTTTEKVNPDSLAGSDPKKAEAIYKSILQGAVARFSASVGVLNDRLR